MGWTGRNRKHHGLRCSKHDILRSADPDLRHSGGALIKTGSAEKIAEIIVEKLGEKRAVAAISIAAMTICTPGVFIDISVITVVPIALVIGKKAGLSQERDSAGHDRRR